MKSGSFSEEIRTVEEEVTCIFNVTATGTKWIVSWKLFLNLCSWRWLSLSHNLIKYLIPFMLWGFWISGSSLFHSMMTDGKKVFLKKLCLTLKWGISFAFLVEYGLFNLEIILKRYFGRSVFQNFVKAEKFSVPPPVLQRL